MELNINETPAAAAAKRTLAIKKPEPIKNIKGGKLPEKVKPMPRIKSVKPFQYRQAQPLTMYKHFASVVIPAGIPFPIAMLGLSQCWLTSEADLGMLKIVDFEQHRFVRIAKHSWSSDWRIAFQPKWWKKWGVKLTAPKNVKVSTDRELRLADIDLRKEFDPMFGGIAIKKGGE